MINKNTAKGFTLIELLVSIVIFSIVIVGTLSVFITATKYSADPMIIHQGIAIAESYLEEIATKDFPSGTCPTPSGGRSTYANICNYYSFAPAAPADQMGNTIAALSRYTVAVNIDRTTAQLGTLTAAANQVVRIDVTISHPNITTMTFSTYRTNY